MKVWEWGVHLPAAQHPLYGSQSRDGSGAALMLSTWSWRPVAVRLLGAEAAGCVLTRSPLTPLMGPVPVYWVSV